MRRFVTAAVAILCVSVPAANRAAADWHYPADWQQSGKAEYYRDGAKVGSYDYYTGYFSPVNGAPYRLQNYPVWKRAVENFGNDYKPAAEPRYSIRGVEATRAECVEQIKQLTDDSDKRRIVVIGTAEACAAAVQAIGKVAWAIVQTFAPDDFQVAEAGFVTGGSPTTYILESDGEVIHRQDDLDGLPLAIRRANPDYDAADDPDLREIIAKSGNGTVMFGVGCACGSGVLGFVWLVVQLILKLWKAHREREDLIRDLIRRLEEQKDA